MSSILRRDYLSLFSNHFALLPLFSEQTKTNNIVLQLLCIPFCLCALNRQFDLEQSVLNLLLFLSFSGGINWREAVSPSVTMTSAPSIIKLCQNYGRAIIGRRKRRVDKLPARVAEVDSSWDHNFAATSSFAAMEMEPIKTINGRHNSKAIPGPGLFSLTPSVRIYGKNKWVTFYCHSLAFCC